MADGAAVRSDTDAELLLHAWRAWGPAMLDRLSGVFALAIHDGGRHALFLARDRLGVRPLHHAELADGSVAFVMPAIYSGKRRPTTACRRRRAGWQGLGGPEGRAPAAPDAERWADP